MTATREDLAGLKMAYELSQMNSFPVSFERSLEQLIEQAQSAEPVQGEAVEYQQLSRYGNWDRIDKATFDLGKLGQSPERFRALYTSPAKPDAELVELLRQASHWLKVHAPAASTEQAIADDIDAKLAAVNKP
jgi:hypothetical protein